jgi:hypothetical protein
MSAAETLVKSKPCHRCGGAIPSGTPLSALEWDRGERAWAHLRPSCSEIRGTAGVEPPNRAPAAASTPPEAPSPDPTKPPSGPGGVPDDPARGVWSVTLEIHDAEDPALSKRVLRIARLHLGTYSEARAVGEALRRGAFVPQTLVPDGGPDAAIASGRQSGVRGPQSNGTSRGWE